MPLALRPPPPFPAGKIFNFWLIVSCRVSFLFSISRSCVMCVNKAGCVCVCVCARACMCVCQSECGIPILNFHFLSRCSRSRLLFNFQVQIGIFSFPPKVPISISQGQEYINVSCKIILYSLVHISLVSCLLIVAHVHLQETRIARIIFIGNVVYMYV